VIAKYVVDTRSAMLARDVTTVVIVDVTGVAAEARMTEAHSNLEVKNAVGGV